MSKPNIRFRGYTEDWEQRKFPEFVSFFNGLTYTPNDVQETGTLVLRSSNVKNGEIIDADNVYVNDRVVTTENVQEGDIIVVVRNGSRALIGKHAQIKASMPNTVIGAFMSGMRSEHSSFVNALLDTSAFENEIAKNMGATINQITGYMFSKMEFMIPAGEEQKKIGEYFSNLDNLITLHQRKCEETRKLKKYMLQKMFPQNGKKFPEIRFKGFTEDWEQRKLGEIADLTSSKRVHAQDYVDSGIPFYRGKEISELREHKPVSEVLYITEEKYKEMAKLYGSPQVGDLLITAVGTIGNTWVVDNVPFYFKDGNLIWFKNIKCNPNYLDYVLSSDDGQKKIDVSAIGSNQKALTMVKLNELKFMFPNDDEQVKIGEYFSCLDNLITLHQQKYEELQKIKKFMLQNMFV